MPAGSAPRRRGGTTLIELVIGIAVGGMVASAIVGVLVRTLRAVSDTTREMLAAREAQLALAPFALELRSASTVPEPLLTDSSAAFSTLVLDGPGCILPDGRVLIAKRVDPVSSGGAWHTLPATRDRALILQEQSGLHDTLDAWSTHAVLDATTSIAVHASCPRPVGSAAPAALLTLDPAPAGDAGDSLVLQVVRRVRWAVTRGGDGAWWLGRRRCDADGSACDPTQPVAGPFLRAADGGIRLAYADSNGVPIVDPATWTDVALIQLWLRPRDARGPTVGAVRRPGR